MQDRSVRALDVEEAALFEDSIALVEAVSSWSMDDVDVLLNLGPATQDRSDDEERRKLARQPCHERLRLVMEQVRFHQSLQARTLTPEERRRRRAAEVAAARRAWGDILP